MQFSDPVHGRECCELLQLASLMAMQFGEEREDLFRILKPILVQIIKDHTVSPEERSAATSTLAFCCFLLCHDMKVSVSEEDIIEGLETNPSTFALRR